MASSLSNKKFANALVNSVLPTPVGPRNRNEPLGRFGSDNPARERRTAFETATTASSCPTTRLCKNSSICRSFSRSPCSIFATGIPVAALTTSAISFSVTLVRISFGSSFSSATSACSRRFCNSGITPYCRRAASAKSPSRCALSNAIRAWSSSIWAFLSPSTSVFSAFQISSISLYSFSMIEICSSR